MEKAFKIYILSPSMEIFDHFVYYANRFGHIIVGRSQYLDNCIYETVDDPPDVIVCSLGLFDSDTPNALRTLCSHDVLSKCVIIPTKLSYERAPDIVDIVSVPFELYSFDDYLRAKVEDKQTNRRPPMIFTPRQRERNKVITDILHRLGMSSDLEGYQMIHRALGMMLDDYGCFKNLSKTVYPKIGEMYSKSGKYAERMMQSAITSSWLKCPLDVRQDIFGNSIDEYPSNKVYLATLAEYITNEYDML